MADAALLAKSARRGRPLLTLEQHLRDTEVAAQLVFRADGRWGAAFARFFRLDSSGQNRFLLNLRVAALFHDVGKANEEFQRALLQRDAPQSLRHEHLSALILHLVEVREWLQANPELDLDAITAAVLSHHLKASEDGVWAWGQSRRADRVALRLGDEQIAQTLRRVSTVAGIPLLEPRWVASWCEDFPWTEALERGRQQARLLRRGMRRADVASSQKRSMLLAVKAGLIVADSVASGLVREGRPIEQWVRDVVHAPSLEPEDVQRSIIQPRLEQLGRNRGEPVSLQPFQELVAKRGPRVLLLAACGAGKTLAAWAWAREQLIANPAGRVVFLYPTRGTATEGFRDYVGWAPEADAALLHGTSRYELDAMAENPPESIEGKRFTDESAERLFALGLWSKRYFSATVDQFLAFMEHRYESLCLLPALADSLVVFDEVHSYDRKLFQNLVMFLQSFDVPVLCMTATLPRTRRQELEQRGLVVFPDSTDRAQLAQLEEKEEHPRYRIQGVAGPGEALNYVRLAAQRGERVLWVVNTVARCQALAAKVREAVDVDVICYHSRFRLGDRKKAHERTVQAFQQARQPVVAVTTQVCEMSLDLDADLLVTELAPASSLVQRFGRANRHLARGADFRAQVLVVPAPDVRPYAREELARASEFVAAVARDDVSQRALAEAMLEHSVDEARLPESGRFLDSGYYATPGTLRDDSDHLMPSVLDADLDDIEECIREDRPFDGFILPAPKRSVAAQDPRPGFLPRHLGVVPAEQYDLRLGFVAGGANL